MVNPSSFSSPEIEPDDLTPTTLLGSMVVSNSTHNNPHLFESTKGKEGFAPTANNAVAYSKPNYNPSSTKVEMEDVKPNSLTNWALSENPSHLFWVPAHLHPEIAPHHFKAWLQKHSSAVNHSETPLTRRKSILSLHSYCGTDFTNEPNTTGEISTKTSLNPSNLRRQLTVTTGVKIPSNKVEVDNEKSPFKPPFLIQSADLRPSLKRSARTKVRRNSVKSTESRTNPIKPSLRKSKSVEGDLSQTKNIGFEKGDDGPEVVSPDSEPGISSTDSTRERSESVTVQEKEALEEFSKSKHLPPRKESLPTLQHSEILPPTKKPEILTEQMPVNSKKKNSSWSWFWGAEASDNTISKVAKSKKPGKSRPSSPEEVGEKAEKLKDESEEEEEEKQREEAIKKKSTKKKKERSDPFKKQANSDIDTLSTSKEPSQLNIDQKTKKPYSPILTFFSKSKSKASQQDEHTSSVANSAKLTTPPKPRYTNYNRLPIHIERGIYRLSHIKLTNPRRPLLQQVLISNMMFWYLSIVSKQSSDPTVAEDRSIKEAMFVKSKVGKTAGVRKRARRSSPDTSDRVSNGKKSEMLVKGPQYTRQHQRIHNGNMSVMLKHSAEARHQLATSRSAYSDSSSDTDSDTGTSPHVKREEDGEEHNQDDVAGAGDGDGDDDDDDDLPLAIYKGNLANSS